MDEACALYVSHSHRHLSRRVGNVPLRRTKPSTTGVTLAVEWPMSMTNAEPFPAANLKKKMGEFFSQVTGSSEQEREIGTDAFNTPVFAM